MHSAKLHDMAFPFFFCILLIITSAKRREFSILFYFIQFYFLICLVMSACICCVLCCQFDTWSILTQLPTIGGGHCSCYAILCDDQHQIAVARMPFSIALTSFNGGFKCRFNRLRFAMQETSICCFCSCCCCCMQFEKASRNAFARRHHGKLRGRSNVRTILIKLPFARTMLLLFLSLFCNWNICEHFAQRNNSSNKN